MGYMNEYISNYEWYNNKKFNIDYIGVIYKCTCILNNKVYIGQTIKKLEDRILGHYRCKKNPQKYKPFYFHKALISHEEDSFIWEIIDTFNSKEEAIYKEKLWVWVMGSYSLDYKYGYNLTEGGEWGDTMSNHPDKERLRLQNSQAQINSPNKPRGKNHPLYGKNDHSFGIVNHAKTRKGKTNEEFYGKEKADQMEAKRKENYLKSKPFHKKLDTEIKVSPELLKFILSYAQWDKTITNIEILCKLFEKNKRTKHVIRRQLRKLFPVEYKKLNALMRSRQTSGENNGRYKKPVCQETRDKIAFANKGKGRKDHKKDIDLNTLVDKYFETLCDIPKIAEFFNVDSSIIYLRLRVLKLKPIKKTARFKKEAFFSSNKKEDFYVKY